MTRHYYNYFYFREFTLTYCADDCSVILLFFVRFFFLNLSIFVFSQMSAGVMTILSENIQQDLQTTVSYEADDYVVTATKE